MDNNQGKQKNAKLTALIAMLLIITTLASCIGLYAWAKYITNQNGQASVDVAKWNFNLSLRAGQNTVTTPTQTLDLATTAYTNVANGTIAPGTSGEFDIVINTQGTEVSLNYEVTIAISDCPRNITFSRQQGTDTSTLTEVSAGGTNSYTRTITFSKYLAKANASGEFVEKIKWNWPYSGEVNESSTTYDQWDTADQGKTARLAITVVGTEVLSDPNAGNQGGNQGNQPAQNSVQSLAQSGAIQRWDTINYNPGNGTTASIEKELPNGASLEDTITASEATNWVVLDVNQKTGEVLIMPRNVPQVNLELAGKDGYNNAIEAINAVAGIYLNPAYATSARSLTVEDINKVENHTPDGEVAENSWNHRYGMNPTTLDITDTGSDSNTPEQTYTSTATTGKYSYEALNFSGSCWLASRCVYVSSNGCFFDVRTLFSGYASADYLLYVNPDGSADENGSGLLSTTSYPVVPVVTLKSNIQLNSASAHAWTIQ